MKKKIVIVFATFLFLSAIGAEYREQDIQRYSAYYSNGMEYLKQGQYSSAIVAFKKVLRFSPYDETTQAQLANAYLARARYYRTTTKEIKKALTDYKSAAFYAKYWTQSPSQTMYALGNTALKEIHDIERRLGTSQNEAGRLQTAKNLKAQGELAASGYDFQILKGGKYQETAYENLGNIYKNLNNVANAMENLRTAIDVNPKNAKLHFLYGVMLDEVQNYEASMEQYNEALKYGDKSPELLEILENKWTSNVVKNPNDAQSYINLGAIYQKQGNFEKAKAQYLKASALDPKDDTSLYNLASLYVQQKNYASAVGIYDKLLQKNPRNEEVLEYKANALKEMKDFDGALKQCDLILMVNANNRNARMMADDIILNHFSGAKLQAYLQGKATANPTNYEAQFNYALELHKSKNLKGAAEYYKRAQSLNPSKEETYINLAQIYIEEKNYAQASQICERGLLIIPSSTELKKYLNDTVSYSASNTYEKGTKLFNEKRYREAIGEYLKIPNRGNEVNLAIASCYYQLKDYQNANMYYNQVLQKDPNNLEALASSAFAYYSMNDKINAKMVANRILAIDKNNADALDLIKSIDTDEIGGLRDEAIKKYEQGLYNEALNLANQVLQKAPNDEYALYYKGLCYDELKNPNEAMKQYKTLISKNPTFASAYYSYAVDADNNENYKEAITYYEKFISLKGNSHDEMTNFSTARVKELKDYLNELNKK